MCFSMFLQKYVLGVCFVLGLGCEVLGFRA